MSEKKYREVYITDASQLRPGMRYRALAGENWYQIHESQLAPSMRGLIELSALEFQEPIEDAQEEGWERIQVGSVEELDPKREYEMQIGAKRWRMFEGDDNEWFIQRPSKGDCFADDFLDSGCEVWRKVEPEEEPMRFEGKAEIKDYRTAVPWIECPVGCEGKTFECIEVKDGYSVVVCKGEPVYALCCHREERTTDIWAQLPAEWKGQMLAVCPVVEKP